MDKATTVKLGREQLKPQRETKQLAKRMTLSFAISNCSHTYTFDKNASIIKQQKRIDPMSKVGLALCESKMKSIVLPRKRRWID